MKLQEAFNIHSGEVISLVGGGGKTTLMFALARELAADHHVITTTTTKVLEPSLDETPLLLVEKDEAYLLERLRQNMAEYRHITLVTERLSTGKLRGISPGTVARIAKLEAAPYIIVEADGANCKPLKTPAAHEPVIPLTTTLVIAVAGIDALGQPLTEANVFRAEMAARLLELPPGVPITADIIARLITNLQGIAKGSPEGATIVPFINKIDTAELLPRGREIAIHILEAKHPAIKRVILGRAKAVEPVIEVVKL